MKRENDEGVPSKAATRVGLLLGVPLVLLVGSYAVSWAAAAIKTWTSGETLTATDLNGNFAAVNAAIDKFQGSGTWHLRGTRTVPLYGDTVYVDAAATSTFTNVTNGVFGPIDGINGTLPALPNSTRHYRLNIASDNLCGPGDGPTYRLYWFYDSRPDDRTYPGRAWADGSVGHAGWEIIDLDHIKDPMGSTSCPNGCWQLQFASATGTCAGQPHRVKNVTIEIYDVMN
jgi:hypothetical protein